MHSNKIVANRNPYNTLEREEAAMRRRNERKHYFRHTQRENERDGQLVLECIDCEIGVSFGKEFCLKNVESITNIQIKDLLMAGKWEIIGSKTDRF